jgi:hypothetical protein
LGQPLFVGKGRAHLFLVALLFEAWTQDCWGVWISAVATEMFQMATIIAGQ